MGCGIFFCNPYCGKCKPARKKLVACPSCGASADLTRGQVAESTRFACQACGCDITDLVRPESVLCDYSGKPCAMPCGRAAAGVPADGHAECPSNIAPR